MVMRQKAICCPQAKFLPKNLDFREKNNHFLAVEHDEVKKHLGVIFRAEEPQRSRCFEWADENRTFIIIEKISIMGTCLRTGQNSNILGRKTPCGFTWAIQVLFFIIENHSHGLAYFFCRILQTHLKTDVAQFIFWTRSCEYQDREVKSWKSNSFA